MPLAPRGLEGTAARAGRLALRGRPVRIGSSDLVRARATADAVGAALGLPVTLDPRLREVSARGEAVKLTFAEFELLQCLMDRPGRLLSLIHISEPTRPY